MAFENNVPSIVNPVVDGLRDISARRAATISNMIDEAASTAWTISSPMTPYGRTVPTTVRNSPSNLASIRPSASSQMISAAITTSRSMR